MRLPAQPDLMNENGWKRGINKYSMLKKNSALLGKYCPSKSKGCWLAWTSSSCIAGLPSSAPWLSRPLSEKAVILTLVTRKYGWGRGRQEGRIWKIKHTHTEAQISNGGSVIFSSYAKNINFTTIQAGSLNLQRLSSRFCTSRRPRAYILFMFSCMYSVVISTGKGDCGECFRVFASELGEENITGIYNSLF